MRPTFVVLVLACVVRCVSPSASERPSRDVVSAETVSQLHVAPHGVVPELFEAAHELLASGDATGALRVLVLCRRLAGADANIELAAAGIRCRAGDLPAAHAGFRLARVLAGQLCPEDGKEGQGCPDADRRQALELMLATSARHGMCLMEARMFAYAAARFRDALAIDQVPPSVFGVRGCERIDAVTGQATRRGMQWACFTSMARLRVGRAARMGPRSRVNA
jgi:hypothetical protein